MKWTSFNIFHCIILVIWGCFTVSCNSTKHLKDEEYLLRKNNIQLKTDINISAKNILKDEIYNTIKQQPNSYFFGIPYRVHFYNLRYNTYQKDSSNYQLRTNFVEAPVVFDSILMLQSAENIQGFLVNQGFFNAEVIPKVTFKGQRASVQYKIATGSNLVINQVSINSPDSIIKNIVRSEMSKTALLKYKDYNHFLVSEERIRIINQLRNWGYFSLNASNISFELDTTQVTIKNTGNPILDDLYKSKKGVNIHIQINETRNKNSFEIHKIKNVNVHLAYQELNPQNEYNSEVFDDITFNFIDRYINFNIINQKILLRPNSTYNQSAYSQTIQLLNELEIFQLVRVVVEPTQENSTDLDVNIILTPNKKYDFSTNVEVTGGDLYTIGSAINASFVNKNLLNGANKFTITGSYGVEINKKNNSESLSGLNKYYVFSQNTGINYNLTFPKFILPVNQKKFSRNMFPKTFLEGGINHLRRTEYFDLRSVNTGLGYRWKSSNFEQWSVKPAFVNLLKLSNISPVFQQRMDSIPAIKNSYQETFIWGEGMEYVYNSEIKNPRNYRILKVGLEESGLIMNGVNALYKSVHQSKNNLSFAEYIRLDFDLRRYLKNAKSEWAFRVYGGVGVPYNKASSLPYIKQYFVGGAYSIRGWRPRVLGPGSYNALDNNDKSLLFVDQAGDMKLEINAEYRFNIISLFGGAIAVNGATFIDAGNIWLINETQNLPGANFKFRNLYQDIACSYGVGLRFDLGGFIVVRTDWAFQAKKPYVKEHNGWTIQNTQFTDGSWRKDNMNFNIAIGYPF